MLHLLISSLSPIITTMQATANSLGLLLPLWQILYLPLVFYSPLRINTDCPSNCNNPEFSVSAESNSCKQKTFITGHNNKKKMFLPIFCIVREVWWFLFGSMTQPVNCGKASWLSMTHIRYSTRAEMTKSALTASWHCWIQTFMFEFMFVHNEICWPRNDFPEQARLSLPHNPKEKNARRRGRKQKCVCKYQCTANCRWTGSRLTMTQHISCFMIPGSITQPHSPQGSMKNEMRSRILHAAHPVLPRNSLPRESLSLWITQTLHYVDVTDPKYSRQHFNTLCSRKCLILSFCPASAGLYPSLMGPKPEQDIKSTKAQ